MLSLVIHHNLYLTREQRYALHARQDVECVGVAVPVWVSGASTSEPAKEVFCRYLLKNTGEQIPIKLVPDGFELVLPDHKAVSRPSIVADQWIEPTEEEKAALQAPGTSSINLLDLADGGTGTLMYREHSKITYDQGDRVTIVHLVQARPIELLKATTNVTPRWAAGSPSAPAKSSE
jgi:hypothetical protein